MRPPIHSFARFMLAPRRKKIERAYFQTPEQTQYAQLKKLIAKGRNTAYGRQWDFDNIHHYETYRKKVPLADYETLQTYILRMREGESHVLWPGKIKWYAQSSGTASARSKYIPMPDEMLEQAHFQGGKDMLLFYLENNPAAQFLNGKTLKLGGTVRHDPQKDIYTGDLSGIMIKRLPFWAEWQSIPEEEISLIPDWEEKLQRIIRLSANTDVRSLVGIPSWFQTLLTGMLDYYGKTSVREIWPHLEVFFHGGIHFEPYRNGFRQLMGEKDIRYMEVYNASEGFFGLQNDLTQNAFLLMLDYLTFYEFIPMDKFEGVHSRETVPLEGVKTGVNYAMVISNASGLWRYIIGDTVRFVSVKPYKFIITGRTKHFINMVGEEVVVDNTEKALKEAAEKHGAVIKNYTVAPVFMQGREKGAHEWMIEFARPPADLRAFTEDLDNALRRLNSDYDTKRTKDISLKMPVVHAAPPGLFDRWLKKHNKLGGQHKVPRLSQTRKIMEELLEMIAGN